MTQDIKPVTPEVQALRRLVVWNGCAKQADAAKRERQERRDPDSIKRCAEAERKEFQERRRLRAAADKLGEGES